MKFSGTSVAIYAVIIVSSFSIIIHIQGKGASQYANAQSTSPHVVYELNVPMKPSPVTYRTQLPVILDTNKHYVIEASGAARVGDRYFGDAEYGYNQANLADNINDCDGNDIGLEILDPGKHSSKIPDWGPINAAHVYVISADWLRGKNVDMNYSDCNFDDNDQNGFIHVKIINENSLPTATIVQSTSSSLVNTQVNFSGANSVDDDGRITHYTWNFGDGTTAEGISVSHTYSSPGTFQVVLTVTDDSGDSRNTAVQTSVRENQLPVPAITLGASSARVGESINFSGGKSSDPDGSISSFSWDFGDGSSGSGANLSHIYNQDGRFVVILTIKDNEGAESSTQSSIDISPTPNLPPVASISSSGPYRTGMQSVFSASSSYDRDGVILDYSWDFGDGGISTGVNVFHSYNKEGSYIVILTVTDDKGEKNTAQFPIDISPSPNSLPTAAISSSGPYIVRKPVSFSASNSIDEDGTIAVYQWDFDDLKKGFGEVVNHSYLKAGKYTVTLTVTDNKGGRDSDKQQIEVVSSSQSNNRAPVAQITLVGPYMTGSEIPFSAKGSYDSDGEIKSYSWNFGDGKEGVGMNVTHSYDKEGPYTVKLTVRDDEGLPDTVQTNPIDVRPKPIASIGPLNLDLATLGSIGGAGGGIVGFVKWLMSRNKK